MEPEKTHCPHCIHSFKEPCVGPLQCMVYNDYCVVVKAECTEYKYGTPKQRAEWHTQLNKA